MQLKVRWMAIPFLAEHGDNHLQSLISTCNYKIIFFIKRRNWKAIRFQISNILGCLFLTGAHLQRKRGTCLRITWLLLGFIFCTVISCQNHPLRRGALIARCLQFLKWYCFSVRLPAAAQYVFVLEIWAWFSTTAAQAAVPLLRVITCLCLYTHAYTGPIEKYLLGFLYSLFYRPWRPWAWENVSSWIILSFLVRFSVKDFWDSSHFNATLNDHWMAMQFSNKLVPISGAPHSFWWNKGFDLILPLLWYLSYCISLSFQIVYPLKNYSSLCNVTLHK